MTNIKLLVLEGLKEIEIVEERVYFYSPDNFTNLPSISYFQLDNIPNVEADDDVYLEKIEFQVESFSRGSSESDELESSIDDAMSNLGFRRTFSGEVYEDDEGIYHRTMKFILFI